MEEPNKDFTQLLYLPLLLLNNVYEMQAEKMKHGVFCFVCFLLLWICHENCATHILPSKQIICF